jgi:hypothetical protein
MAVERLMRCENIVALSEELAFIGGCCRSGGINLTLLTSARNRCQVVEDQIFPYRSPSRWYGEIQGARSVAGYGSAGDVMDKIRLKPLLTS